MENRTRNHIDFRNLGTGGKWEDVQTSIQAKVFEILLELAQDRVKQYKSDLFHDAVFIKEMLTGPMSFDWIVRDSGTFIGSIASNVDMKDWKGAIRYRFDIYNDDGTWRLDIYEDCPTVTESNLLHSENEAYQLQLSRGSEPVCTGYVYYNGSLQHDGGTCPIHELDSENNPTLRNESQETRIGKEDTYMEYIIRELREKLDDANSARDDAYSHQNDLNEVIGELDEYVDKVEDLLSTLEDLPSVSVDFEATISFES